MEHHSARGGAAEGDICHPSRHRARRLSEDSQSHHAQRVGIGVGCRHSTDVSFASMVSRLKHLLAELKAPILRIHLDA
jgi:hypothetical protein